MLVRLLADEADMLLLAKGLFLRDVKVSVKATSGVDMLDHERSYHSSRSCHHCSQLGGLNQPCL
jgi:hypothetical protein